jgi:hypothetical protein
VSANDDVCELTCSFASAAMLLKRFQRMFTCFPRQRRVHSSLKSSDD